MSELPRDLPRWPAPFLKLVETALNRVLALDSGAVHSLQALEGRSVALRLKPWPSPLQLKVVDGRLRASDADAADLSVAMTPGAILALAAERGGFELPAGRIDIAGDADLARRVQKLVAQLDPDWDAPLAALFGEVVGHQVGKGLRGVFAWGRATARAMALNSAEYLREESRDLVAPAELDQFIDAVDALREDTDRAQARLRRLEQRRAAQRAAQRAAPTAGPAC